MAFFSRYLVAEVREKFTVQQLTYASFTVFLLLTGSEFLLQPLMAFFGGDDFVFFVVVDFVDVCNDELERVGVASNGLEDLLVVFNAKCPHEQHDRNGGGPCGADLLDMPVSSLSTVRSLRIPSLRKF